jgi:hypothetical protein
MINNCSSIFSKSIIGQNPDMIEEKIHIITNRVINIITKKIIDYKYDSNTYINNMHADSDIKLIDDNNMYHKFWSSFFSALKTMRLEMIKNKNSYNSNANKYNSIHNIVFANTKYLSIADYFFKMCYDYNKVIELAFSNSEYFLMFSILDEFMSNHNIIIILIGVLNTNTAFIRHTITSMKRWAKFKPEYIADPMRNKHYKFINLVGKLIDNLSDIETLLELIAAFTDIIADPIDADIGLIVLDLAVRNKSVTIMDIFRDNIDTKHYMIGYDKCNITQISSLKLIKLLEKTSPRYR